MGTGFVKVTAAAADEDPASYNRTPSAAVAGSTEAQ